MKDDAWRSTGLEVLTEKDFEGKRLRRRGLYAVCFAATWCPPTQRFVPSFVAQKGKLPAHLAMADITDWDDPLWEVFGIEISPTLVVFRDGLLVARFDGRPGTGLADRDLDALASALKSPEDPRTGP